MADRLRDLQAAISYLSVLADLVDPARIGAFGASAGATYVGGLRRALEPDRASHQPGRVLTTNGSGYRLCLDPSQLDLLAFEAQLGQARRTRSAGKLVDALDGFDAALGCRRSCNSPV
jgi:hypothetical protein